MALDPYLNSKSSNFVEVADNNILSIIFKNILTFILMSAKMTYRTDAYKGIFLKTSLNNIVQNLISQRLEQYSISRFRSIPGELDFSRLRVRFRLRSAVRSKPSVVPWFYRIPSFWFRCFIRFECQVNVIRRKYIFEVVRYCWSFALKSFDNLIPL